jgi:hypothetical protein
MLFVGLCIEATRKGELPLGEWLGNLQKKEEEGLGMVDLLE